MLGYALSLCGVFEPAESTAKCTTAATTDEETLGTHESAHCSKGFKIIGLDPDVDIGWLAREYNGDEIVADAFNDVGSAAVSGVEVVREGTDASFLYVKVD
jgi:hypothetical protein